MRRPCTTAAPSSGRRAARGRGRARPSPARARDLASTTLSISASTTGSLMPARLKLPSMRGGVRAPVALQLDARRQAQRVALRSTMSKSNDFMRRSYCAGSTRRMRGVDADALQVLDVGNDDAVEAVLEGQDLDRRALAAVARVAGRRSSQLVSSARLQKLAIAPDAVGHRRRVGLAEHLRRQLVPERLEQRQLLRRSAGPWPSCPSSRRSSACACRARRTGSCSIHSKSKARPSASRTRLSLNWLAARVDEEALRAGRALVGHDRGA